MSDAERGDRPAVDESLDERLDTWKEIAAYLQRDVRTVQRWEKQKGLPVHRHVHEKAASVYAFRSEIDEWWHSRSPDAVSETGDSSRRPARIAAAAAVVVVILVLGSWLAGWYALPGADGSADARLVASRVWEGPAEAISPDGRFLTLVAEESGDLALFDRRGGNRRLLTSKGSRSRSWGFAGASVFAPDGRSIAYAWSGPDVGETDSSVAIRLVAPEGGSSRSLFSTPSADWMTPLDWSPSGDALLVAVSLAGRIELRMVSVADGSSRLLKRDFAGSARFAPDGETIAFERAGESSEGARDIYLLTADRSREWPLVTHPSDDALLDWTPDGEWLLFASDRSGSLATWAIRVVDGQPLGPPRTVMPGPERIDPLGFTADGTFWYLASVPGESVYVAAVDPVDGTLVEPPHRVGHRGEGFTRWPEWSPDGKWLASVFTRADGTQILSFASPTGGDTRLLETPLTALHRLRWHPEGDRLLVPGRDAERSGGMFLVDVETGGVTTVQRSDGPRFPRQAHWSADGHSILYRRSGGGPILRRSLAGAAERAVHPGDDRLFDFVPSPDGSRLLLYGYGLAVASLEGGGRRSLVETGEDQLILSAVWSKDLRHVLFVKSRVGGGGPPAELWRVPVDGGRAVRLGMTMPGLRELRLHPDGRLLAFSAGSRDRELWSLENLSSELSAPR